MKAALCITFALVAVVSALPQLRITNGDSATAGQFPYQAGLRVVKTVLNKNVTYICGGSLISNNYVLTSSDCINKGLLINVVLGSTNLSSSDSSSLSLESSEIIYHENFTTLLNYDIALVKLPSAVEYTDNIQAVTLASDDSVTYAGLNGTVSGYGYTSDSNTDLTLHYITNPILTNTACKTSAGLGDLLTSAHICLDASDGKAACNRDYGGPLVVDGVQVGIASYRNGGCEDGTAGIYTRVSSYIDWIKENANLS